MGRLIDVIELKKQIVYSNILNDGITLDDLDQIIDEVPTIEPQRTGKYHDQFGNPIYVYVRVGDKTVTIKADDLQKTLDYVTKHGEEVTIEGRRKAVDTAISALQEQEAKHSTESSSTHKALDTISRQAAIDAIRASTSKYTGFMAMEMYTDDDAVEAIEGLPSAQPEPSSVRESDADHIWYKGKQFISLTRVNTMLMEHPKYTDIISRQAAVEAIEEHASCVLNSYPYEQVTKDIYEAAHRHIIEVINALPTV